jgi:hypothetical protein
LFVGKRSAFGNAVPFFQARAAAYSGGMLGNEDGMAAHGRLSAVVFRFYRGKAFEEKFPAVFQNCEKRFFGQISTFFLPEFKPAAKFAFCKGGKEAVERHRRQKIGYRQQVICLLIPTLSMIAFRPENMADSAKFARLISRRTVHWLRRTQ